MTKFLEMFGSKKFTVAILTVAVVIINKVLGWNIADEMVDKIANVAMVYIGAQGVADGLSGGKTSSANKTAA
jgi:hypothetical protein